MATQQIKRKMEQVRSAIQQAPARVQTSSPDRLAADAERERLEGAFYDFVRATWHCIESAEFVDNWHIECVCNHLQAVTEGTIENLLVNIPPGCSKSVVTSVFWPAWEWARDPSVRFFYASYDQRLSTRDSVRCRALLSSSWFQDRWGEKVKLANDQNQKTYYETTSGGYRLATSVGGHGLGQHPDRIVVDDPQDPKGAESEADRQATLDWWDYTMSTRGVSRGVRRVGIMQRLSSDDFSAHVLAEGGWTHVCLPMRSEPGRMAPSPVRDPEGNQWQDPRAEEGELLAPVQFPEQAVATMEKRLGSYGVAGQLQQRPAPKGGVLFKRVWCENKCRYELLNGDSLIRQGKPGVLPLANCGIFAIVDGGASSKVTSDATAISFFAAAPDGDLFVLEVLHARLEVEQVVPLVDDWCRYYRPDWVGIEANGFQIWFVKEARRKEVYSNLPTIRELQPEGKSKAARAAPAIIRAEQGQIWLPHPNDQQKPWVGDFEEELYAFTGKEGRPDDRRDTLSYAVLAIDKLGYVGASEELPAVSSDYPSWHPQARAW